MVDFVGAFISEGTKNFCHGTNGVTTLDTLVDTHFFLSLGLGDVMDISFSIYTSIFWAIVRHKDINFQIGLNIYIYSHEEAVGNFT